MNDMDKWSPRPFVWSTVAILLAGGDAMLDNFKGDNGIDIGTVLKALQMNSTETSTSHYVVNTIQGPDFEITLPTGLVFKLKRLPRRQP